MSVKGIKKFAEVMSVMQQTRYELLSMHEDVSTDEAKQDILLAQLLDDAKDAIKDRFGKITMSSCTPSKHRPPVKDNEAVRRG